MFRHFFPCCAVLFISASVLLNGCAYHGQIRRGIYNKPDFPEKVNARVMVVADKFYPKNLTLDGSSDYTFDLFDGLPIAVADALGTLLTEVEVNQYQYRKQYDYVAEVDYRADLIAGPAEIRLRNALRSQVVFRPVLHTALTLTMRNPQTGYAVARYEKDRYTPAPSSGSDSQLWISSFLRIVTLGLFIPLETQAYGSQIRRLLEKGITDILSREIMPEMAESRMNFTKAHETEKTNTRVDGKFIPFMQATVYIYTNDGLGSGFLISPDGYIVTNRHVVGDARDVSVVLYDQRAVMDKTTPTDYPSAAVMSNRVRFAKVIKSNKTRDLALLKIEGENLPWLELETDRSAYATGEEVVAIGAPKGVEWSVSRGIVSAVRDNNGVDTLQTDASINQGNSGGPLISLQTGRVVGVNTWTRGAGSMQELRAGIQNLNFAVSAYEVGRTLGLTQPVNEVLFSFPEE